MVAVQNQQYVAQSPAEKRILLVEDSVSDATLIRFMLRDIVRSEHIEFCVSATLAAAVIALREQQFDMAIVDLGLPDSDGPMAVAALRSTAPSLPLLVHTGSPDPALRNQAILCGANYYWNKGRESSIFFRDLVQQALEQQH